MNIVDRYCLCFDQAFESDLDFLELCKAWEVSIPQGKHLLQTGKMIRHREWHLN